MQVHLTSPLTGEALRLETPEPSPLWVALRYGRAWIEAAIEQNEFDMETARERCWPSAEFALTGAIAEKRRQLALVDRQIEIETARKRRA